MSFLRFRTLGITTGLLVSIACGDTSTPPEGPPPPAVRGVSVSPTVATIRVGQTWTFTATVDVIGGASTAVTWRSADETVAAVSADGLVTGISPGTTVLWALSVGDPRVSASATVTVLPGWKITIAPTSVMIGTLQRVQLTAGLQTEPGVATTISWRSKAPNIATVNDSGVVTGVSLGSTAVEAISAADTTVRESVAVNIVPVVRSVTITPEVTSVFIGMTQQIEAAVMADSGASRAVKWQSANPAIATVSSTGLVSGVARGSTIITATSTADTAISAAVIVTVPVRPITVSIIDRRVSVNPRTSLALTVSVTADPGSTSLSWSSGTPGVATVNENGTVTGVAVGTTLLTARSSADTAKFDTVTVSVIPRLASTWTAGRLAGALYDDVVAIAPFDDSHAFVINQDGDILAWNGTDWAISTKGATYNTVFFAVHGSSGDNVFAVGSGGIIVRWNGVKWAPLTSGTTQMLYGVWVESPREAWAVGSEGNALHWDGSVWSTERTGNTTVLNDVWAADGVVYAVGAYGEIVRRVYSTWEKVLIPTSETLYGVHGMDISDVTVVGDFGTMMHWDGATWTNINSADLTGGFYSITGSTAYNGRRYAVGDDGLVQIDGNRMTMVPTPYAPRLYGVGLDLSGAVWTTGQRGSVMRGGASWTTLNLAPDLIDVWATSTSNAWAVGEFGSVYRWDGTSWTRQQTPTTSTLQAVWGLNPSEAYAAGEQGTVLRWDGSRWSTMSFPSSNTIYALWGANGSHVYATTDAGEVFRYNGSTWSLMTRAHDALWAIFGFGIDDLLASGERGTVVRLDGSTWSTLPAPGDGTLAGLWARSPQHLFLVGATSEGTEAVGYRWSGAAWTTLGLSTSGILTSIWGPNAVDLYTTGDAGTIFHYNGSTWESMQTGTDDLLWSVSGAPDGTGGAFAVGYNSTVVTGAGPGNAMRSSLRLRSAAERQRSSLEPAVGARLRRGPLPDSQERTLRRRRTSRVR